MLIYRLCKQIYSTAVLSGDGGLHVDGRWHTQGRAIVYCATSEALAVLELRVHVGNCLPKAAFTMHEIYVPDATVQTLVAAKLHDGWNAVPHSAISQSIGDHWLAQGTSLALRVPSIHSTSEFNVLLNPGHRQHARAKLRRVWEYRFDSRLFAGEIISDPPKPRLRRPKVPSQKP